MTQDVIRQNGHLRSFRWKCMDGRVLTLEEMKTKHIFNSMKMVFNHLAEAHGGEPVWFERHYEIYEEMCERFPQAQAELVVFFLAEIERRGDLPAFYNEPYRLIKEQIIPMGKRIESAVPLLEGKCG